MEELTVPKISKIHLISWGRNFAETPSLCKVLVDSHEFCENCAFPQNFYPRNVGQITVLHTMQCHFSVPQY